MKRLALLTIALLCLGTASAQVYKWVDDKGVTHYSDQPPPPSAPTKTKVEVKSFSTGGASVELPQELADAVRNRPVTLYTTAQCDGCDNARAMLMARGIPFNEKTVATVDDQFALKKAGGNGQLPLLLVGRSKLTGFEQNSWDVLLSDAGYPLEKRLPPNYQFPAPVSAAQPPAPPPEAVRPVEELTKPLPPVNAPPGFQF
ncbi:MULTISPECIES: glutaredoxin family protein [unclassified Duganella]|uniref:glutaredoxin family protein n=1 Tax=unclassified Duganella TaxID=2636909 RepID=UPI000E34342E|nr:MULTISPECIES: glutaredoxin family protein [unclassified Duganella]RFP14962.1 glutaredoxin family protein [Duganella sp. BJB475]RFP31312.1 glutaredoxin family protein [Duganella sp. BJB476]